ncbi:hypothetical protein ACNPMX_03495 [Stenotrophomonas maltophilia]
MPSAGSALQFRHIPPIPRSKSFSMVDGQVVRTFSIAAMLVASTPALAEPSSSLQIRLTVVDSCSDDTGGARCTAPHQRSDTPQLPSQVRELAPPATDENATPAVTLIY